MSGTAEPLAAKAAEYVAETRRLNTIGTTTEETFYPAIRDLLTAVHDTNPGKADSEPINDGELQGFVQRTLAIVGGY